MQAPCKVDKYGDAAVNGRLDFSNQNADELLSKLRAQGVDALDLRDSLQEWAEEDCNSWHEYFYRTDHHWKPETALKAAKVIGERLEGYGIAVDDSHYSIDQFEVKVWPNFFLGSEGKKVTLAKADADDFSILYPKFPTQMHFVVPSLNLNEVGDFTVVYDKEQIAQRDFYAKTGRSPYGFYSYARRSIEYFENLQLPASEKKVLLIRDSYSNPMGPFLALGVKNMAMLCPAFFTGSIRTFIEEYKPDVVVVMFYAGNLSGKINWKNHKDNFDFR